MVLVPFRHAADFLFERANQAHQSKLLIAAILGLDERQVQNPTARSLRVGFAKRLSNVSERKRPCYQGLYPERATRFELATLTLAKCPM